MASVLNWHELCTGAASYCAAGSCNNVVHPGKVIVQAQQEAVLSMTAAVAECIAFVDSSVGIAVGISP